jgi:RNA polymerase sigma factor (sigma-70 family)
MKSDQIPRIGYDPNAFEAFYREYVEVVQRFITRRVHDPHLAADLTADVFLAVIDNAASYDVRRGDPAAWLHGIARNVVSGEHRRVARTQRLQVRIEGRRLVDDDDIERLVERIDAESQSRQLAVAIAGLPETERAVLELVAVDGLTVSEAAAALGIRAVTARVRLHRARVTLRGQPSDAQPLTAQPTVPSHLEAS